MTIGLGSPQSFAVVRIDQLTDTAGDLRRALAYWREQEDPPYFLSVQELDDPSSSGFARHTYRLLVVVVAHTKEYFLAIRGLLDSENIPFVGAILAPGPQEVPWVQQIHSLMPALASAAEKGLQTLVINHGGGTVRYFLNSSAGRRKTINELLRRCSVVPLDQLPTYLEQIARGCEEVLGAEVADGFRRFLQPATGLALDEIDLYLPQNLFAIAPSRFQSAVQIGSNNVFARQIIPAVWPSFYFERCGEITPTPSPEGPMEIGGVERRPVIALHSVQQRTATLSGLGENIIPSLSLPETNKDFEELHSRLVQVDSSAAKEATEPRTLSVFVRWGGKRAWLTLLISILRFKLGGYRAYESVRFSEVKRVVFFCAGNINRSAYAAVRLKQLGFGNVVSFGVSARPGDAASVEALERAASEGMSLCNHVATSLDEFEVFPGDLLVGFEDSQVRHVKSECSRKNRAAQYTLVGLWGDSSLPYVQDPIVRSPEYFELCFNRISGAVAGLYRALSTSGIDTKAVN